jgi:dTDP-4-amino-4,6-dideoxygalactose transaminase
MPAIRRLERRLADYIGRAYCVVVGSGTLALTLALRGLELPGGSEVIVPAICCEAVPYAITYAGLTPVFCDVATSDYNLRVESMAKLISPRTRAVIPVHTFGYPARVTEISRCAADNGLVVIEDAAQAFGGSFRGTKLGAFGDISITSFGYAKILDVGSGGAMFTDDVSLDRSLRRLKVGVRTYDARLGQRARQAYARLEAFKEERSRLSKLQRLRLPIAESLFRIVSFRAVTGSWADYVWKRLDGFDTELAIRADNSRMYRRLITTHAVTHPDYDEHEGTCFRYSVLTRGDRNRILAQLARRGEGVTRLYPALHKVYGDSRSPRRDDLTGAEFVGSHILNLEVKPTCGEDRIRRIALLVNELA